MYRAGERGPHQRRPVWEQCNLIAHPGHVGQAADFVSNVRARVFQLNRPGESHDSILYLSVNVFIVTFAVYDLCSGGQNLLIVPPAPGTIRRA